MKQISFRSLLSCVFLIFLFQCSQKENLVIRHQVSGMNETNCYLIYDENSKEAALIDVSGSIDTLTAHIQKNHLKLKYIFVSHGHMDHMDGIPALREKYPNAKLCFNKKDFQNFKDTPAWADKNIPPKDLAEAKKNPVIKMWYEFDSATLGKIDIYMEDSQIYKLGNLEIRTILAPGHSSRSICLYVKNALFSGDVLFHKKVGRTDFLGGSGKEIVKSVRKLYAQFPDDTKVYPGHGQFTTIGAEKNENDEVTIKKATLEN